LGRRGPDGDGIQRYDDAAGVDEELNHALVTVGTHVRLTTLQNSEEAVREIKRLAASASDAEWRALGAYQRRVSEIQYGLSTVSPTWLREHLGLLPVLSDSERRRLHELLDLLASRRRHWNEWVRLDAAWLRDVLDTLPGVTGDEWAVLMDYLNSEPAGQLGGAWLSSHVGALRRIRGRPPRPRWAFWLSEQHEPPGPLAAFERWYNRTRSFGAVGRGPHGASPASRRGRVEGKADFVAR
jgi:hypothetical protein